MVLSKRSKRFSGATFWASSKATTGLLLLATLALPLERARAEGGVVSAVGAGRDSGEAIAGLLRGVIGKNFAGEPAPLTKAILQSEILPNASSFVQSYRLLESNKSGVTLSASVDLDVIQGLLNLTAAKLGAGEGAKAAVVVRGVKLSEAVLKATKGPATPFAVLENAAKDRFERRGFAPVALSPDEAQSLSAGEEVTAPELLRGLGTRAGARLALGIGVRREQFENENSHSKDERYVMSATLVDVKTGATLSRASVNVPEPKGRRDTYVADLQRYLNEDSKDLFQDLFVAAGRHLAPAEAQEDFSVLRVQYPSNPSLVTKLRLLLEGASGVKSATEYSVRRGTLDLAVRPPVRGEALAKLVQGLKSEEITITPAQTLTDSSERTPDLTVRLSPKVIAPVGGPSAMDQEDAVNANP